MLAAAPLVPAAASVAGAVAVPLFSAAADKIANAYHSYGEEQVREIREIHKAYRVFCLPLESNHTLTTLKVVQENLEKQKDNPTLDLPIYFQMENEKCKIPLLFRKGFYPNKDMSDWLRFINKSSPLRHLVEEAIGYICQYQCERDEKNWGIGGGYNYDPTNLFFEEFKCWLIELSKARLDDNVLKIVEARMRYVRKLYDTDDVFKPGKEAPVRKVIFYYLFEILEKGIKPCVTLSISRQGAREQFEQLKWHVDDSIKNMIKFLFYVFRDTVNTPVNFILEQVRSPSIPSYDSIVATSSGRLLQYLLNTPLLKAVFPAIRPAKERVEANQEELLSNPFLNANNQLVCPLIMVVEEKSLAIYPAPQPVDKKLKIIPLTVDNWYQPSEKKPELAGVLTEFKINKETMHDFLKMHAELQKLCLFSIICDELYELSGDGGNLMVYGLALTKVLAALEAYIKQMSEITRLINKLYKVADHYKLSLLENPNIKQTEDMKNWGKLFQHMSHAYQNVDASRQKAEQAIANIKRKIEEVSSYEYLMAVKQRLDHLTSLVEQFSGKNIQHNQAKPSAPISALPTFFSGSAAPALPAPGANILPVVEADEDERPETVIDLYGKGSEKISDRQLESIIKLLKKNRGIERINLQKNQITGQGAALLFQALKNYTSIRQIEMYDNKLGAKGAEALGRWLREENRCYYLKNIDINQNNIGSAGGLGLVEGLRVNQTIEELDLGYNDMGDETVIKIAEALKDHPRLSTLKLSGNKLTNKVIPAIRDLIQNNKNITFMDLNDNQIPLDELNYIRAILKQRQETYQAFKEQEHQRKELIMLRQKK